MTTHGMLDRTMVGRRAVGKPSSRIELAPDNVPKKSCSTYRKTIVPANVYSIVAENGAVKSVEVATKLPSVIPAPAGVVSGIKSRI